MTLTRIQKEILDKAISLHGHLGPFLVLGLRMGLRAVSIIGRASSCEVFAPIKKPYVCAVDGLKTIIGDSIVLREGEGLSARFSNGKDSIVIKVRENIVKKYAKTIWEECEENARLIMESSDEEIFES